MKGGGDLELLGFSKERNWNSSSDFRKIRPEVFFVGILECVEARELMAGNDRKPVFGYRFESDRSFAGNLMRIWMSRSWLQEIISAEELESITFFNSKYEVEKVREAE